MQEQLYNKNFTICPHKIETFLNTFSSYCISKMCLHSYVNKEWHKDVSVAV